MAKLTEINDRRLVDFLQTAATYRLLSLLRASSSGFSILHIRSKRAVLIQINERRS